MRLKKSFNERKERLKKMKRFKNYAFWVALAGAVVIFLDDLKMLLGLDFDTAIVQSIILSFCGVLVVLGIVRKKDDETSITIDEGTEQSDLDNLLPNGEIKEDKDNDNIDYDNN